MKPKHFSEFRPNDYRTPRSMKDAYGWDARIYVEEESSWRPVLLTVLAMGVVGMVLIQIAKRMVA